MSLLKTSLPFALSLVAVAASAQTFTTEMYGATGAPGGGRYNDSACLTVTESGPQTLAMARISQGTNSNSWSATQVTAKSIRANSGVHLADPTEGDQSPYYCATNSKTTLTDRIVVASEDRWGDGTMKVRMRVSGAVSAACWTNSRDYGWDEAEAEYFFSFEAKRAWGVPTNFYRHRYATYRITGDGPDSHNFYQGGFTNPPELDDQDVVELIVPFSFNGGFDLSIGLKTAASVTGTVGAAGVDFGGAVSPGVQAFGAPTTSFEWLGIVEVRDETGALVNDYTATGLGGADYRTGAQAVPEPASMAALGLGALAVLRRRRRG